MEALILQKQKDNLPFFIGRLSGNETHMVGKIMSGNGFGIHIIHKMLVSAGICLTCEEDAELYAKLYHKSVSNCDMLGVWTGAMRESAIEYYDIIDRQLPDLPRIAAQKLEPYYSMGSDFPRIFEGKRVLIITSHYNTTKRQLEKTDKLFDPPLFGKTTTFTVYKAPQQNCGSSDGMSWTAHLEKMKLDIKELDFDIALVSCGGFGMIICDHIFSELKKSVMYVGGALQIYFGIMGQRWRTNEGILKHVNENWTYPLDEDKPKNPNLCENNCYW